MHHPTHILPITALHPLILARTVRLKVHNFYPSLSLSLKTKFQHYPPTHMLQCFSLFTTTHTFHLFLTHTHTLFSPYIKSVDITKKMKERERERL
mmetsp:Transcript_8184/g.11017  ORF Transcript_8184/g.11017 Transcript_8184/m.11017 type:complete len:95 (-) Transcript_8184:38-322(-)